MHLLLSSALAQWATFEPPSSAPSLAPWREGQHIEAGFGLATGLGGDGTTLTDTDFPGPGFLDAFADLQFSAAYRLRPETDLIFTSYIGTGSILGLGVGARFWLARNDLGGLGLQLDMGLLYMRVALPMVVTIDQISFYCAPTFQLAFGAQMRTPFGISVTPAGMPHLVLTLESGIAVTLQESVPPEWDEGVKYYGAVTASYRGGKPQLQRR